MLIIFQILKSSYAILVFHQFSRQLNLTFSVIKERTFSPCKQICFWIWPLTMFCKMLHFMIVCKPLSEAEYLKFPVWTVWLVTQSTWLFLLCEFLFCKDKIFRQRGMRENHRTFDFLSKNAVWGRIVSDETTISFIEI